jgi:hypothetical protein
MRPSVHACLFRQYCLSERLPALVRDCKTATWQVLVLFKDWVKTQRPKLDIDLVATGETWCVSLSCECLCL